MFFRIACCCLVFVVLCQRGIGQSPFSSGESEPDGGRPRSTQVGFFELMESGGDALLDQFKPDHQKYTVNSPQYDSLASPRDTIMTFVEAMEHVVQGRREALPRALKTMQGSQNEATATALLNIFDRLPEMTAGSIPGSKLVNRNDITRFELFPRGIQSDWLYKALGSAPAGKITLAIEDGQWKFDSETIDGIDGLLKSVVDIPPRPRMEQKGQLFLSVVEPSFQKTSLIDWLLAALWAAGGVTIAWAIYKVLSKIIAKFSIRGDDFITPILTSVMIPAVILCVVIGIAIGSAKIYMHPALSQFRWNVIEAAAVLAGVYLLVSIIELCCLGFRRTFYGTDDPYARMMSLVVRRGLRVIATIVLLLFVFQNVFKWNVTALIGGFSIIALALSLAAQDAVKNLFGALTIFANRPFIDGDWIKFGDAIGKVEDVSLQVTQMRLLSGEVLSVPNMKFIDSAVENLSKRKYFRRIMNVQITYDTPVEKVDQAMQILDEVLTSDAVVANRQGDMEEHPPKVAFESFGPHYLNLRADYWYMMDDEANQIQRDTDRGWLSYLQHSTKVNRMVLKRFNEAEIDFAFPTQSIYLENASDGVSKIASETAPGV